MADLEITRYQGALVENTRLQFQKLYLRQFTAASSKIKIKVDGDIVSNWQIYDDAAKGALVARPRGIRVHALDSYVSFTMEFEIERFRGSTLEIVGAGVDEQGEWAIVGGTGDFAMARGVIARTAYQKVSGGKAQELTIDAFCRMKLVAPKKTESWGGSGGDVRDITEQPQHLESIAIRAEGVIDSFEFSYFDQTLKKQTVGPWGAGGPSGATTTTIQLRPSEIVMEVSGTVGNIFGNTVITSLTIVTSARTYGPFGNPSFDGEENNKPFSTAVPKDKSIVGFFGRSSTFVDSIGFYIA